MRGRKGPHQQWKAINSRHGNLVTALLIALTVGHEQHGELMTHRNKTYCLARTLAISSYINFTRLPSSFSEYFLMTG